MKAMLPNEPGSVQIGQAPEPVPTCHEAVMFVEASSVNRGETFRLDSPLADTQDDIRERRLRGNAVLDGNAVLEMIS